MDGVGSSSGAPGHSSMADSERTSGEDIESGGASSSAEVPSRSAQIRADVAARRSIEVQQPDQGGVRRNRCCSWLCCPSCFSCKTVAKSYRIISWIFVAISVSYFILMMTGVLPGATDRYFLAVFIAVSSALSGYFTGGYIDSLSFQQQIDRFTEENNRLSATVDALSDEVDNLALQVDRMRGENDRYEAFNNQMGENIGQFKGQIAAFADLIREYDAIAAHEIDRMVEVGDRQQASVEHIERVATVLDQIFNKVKDSFESFNQNVITLRGQVHNLEETRQGLMAINHNLANNVEVGGSLLALQRETTHQGEELQKSRQELFAEEQALQRERENLYAEEKALQTSRQELYDRERSLQRENEALNRELRETAQKLSQVGEQFEGARGRGLKHAVRVLVLHRKERELEAIIGKIREANPDLVAEVERAVTEGEIPLEEECRNCLRQS